MFVFMRSLLYGQMFFIEAVCVQQVSLKMCFDNACACRQDTLNLLPMMLCIPRRTVLLWVAIWALYWPIFAWVITRDFCSTSFIKPTSTGSALIIPFQFLIPPMIFFQNFILSMHPSVCYGGWERWKITLS